MKKFLKFGCGGLIALFVLIMVIGILSSNNAEKSKEETTGSNTGKNETEKQEPAVDDGGEEARIGEELTVGKVTFKVNSFEEVQQISAANGYMKYEPDAEGAVFLTVNATIRNDGTEMIQTNSSFFKLLSDKGATYSPSTIIVADDKYFTFEGINPGLASTGNVVFEVPGGLTGLELQVQTGFWGTETGTITLN